MGSEEKFNAKIDSNHDQTEMFLGELQQELMEIKDTIHIQKNNKQRLQRRAKKAKRPGVQVLSFYR